MCERHEYNMLSLTLGPARSRNFMHGSSDYEETPQSHFHIQSLPLEKTGIPLNGKETTMDHIRAPPTNWHNYEWTFHCNDERAAHPARCAALFVFTQLGK